MGNICRSPAAEGVFRSIVDARGDAGGFEIDSAGTYGGHAGELPDSRMREAARRRGYELTHRSRQVRRDDFARFDMIIAMDDANYHNLFRLAPNVEDREKIFRMVEFANRSDYDHIPDPYYEGSEGFELVMDLLEDACQGLFDSIRMNEI